MKDTIYLTLDRGGVRKMTKGQPYLDPAQVAIKIQVQVDDRHFQAPFVTATLRVDHEHLIQPEAQIDVLDPPEPEVDDEGPPERTFEADIR